MYGLLDRDIKNIIYVINKYLEIDEAIIFGSRAMGNYKKGSDVDLAIKGKEVNKEIVNKLSDELNEVYPLPYFFDVICYNDISNEELINHIDMVGKIIFKRTENLQL